MLVSKEVLFLVLVLVLKNGLFLHHWEKITLPLLLDAKLTQCELTDANIQTR